MDLTIIAIFVSLIFVGAFFFGYPVGKIIGGRQKMREIEQRYVLFTQADLARINKRLESKDILNALILEEKNNGGIQRNRI